jgi:glycosyltransferase involved in cell wall biosynthesis
MASDPPRILVAVPVYNNARTVSTVAAGCAALGFQVLVVNDGSTDGTAASLEGLSVNRIDFPLNRGKGAAIKAAGAWAAENGFTHVVTIDADGQHHPEDLPLFAAELARSPRSLVIGERHFDHDSVPGISKFGRKFSNFWIRATSGRSVGDSQSGFRGYPVEVLTRIRTRAVRYNFEMEILVRSIWAGVSIGAVPIRVHYSEETKAGSSFRPFVDNARISLSFTRMFFRRLLPIPHRKLFHET